MRGIFWESEAFHYLIFAALFFIIVIGVQMAAYIVNLFLISLILTMLMLPAMDLLRKRGVSNFAAALLVTLFAGILILVLVLLVFFSFEVLIHDLPLYQADFNARVSEILTFLNSYGITTGSFSASSLNLNTLANVLLSSISSVGDLLMYLFFIVVTTFFMTLETPALYGRMEKVLKKKSKTMEHLSRMSNFMVDFVIVRTETNLVHGLAFGACLWAMGVHSAVLWGCLTFILAYIPYIGLIIAAIPPLFFAWLQFGTWGVVGVLVAVCVLNAVVENLVFTRFASGRFELPALVVIVSVVFWGWLLGMPGMIFAVPITLIIIILIQSSDEIRYLNTLLGVDHLFEEHDPQ